MIVQARRPPRTISFSCDGCPSEFLETEKFSLREASTALSESGWVVAKIDGEFRHYCNGCAARLGIL